MKIDKSLELYDFIKNLIFYNNQKSKETYKKIEPLLQEPSHSFGFKIFSDISGNLTDGIDKILNNEDFSYFVYENYFKDKIVNDDIIKQLKGKDKKLLELILKELDVFN